MPSMMSPPSYLRTALARHHTPFLILPFLSEPTINQLLIRTKPIIVSGDRSRRRNRRGISPLDMGGGRLGVGVRESRGPARRAETGRVEDGIVDVD